MSLVPRILYGDNQYKGKVKMMKIRIATLAAATAFLSACADDIDEYETTSNDAAEVEEEGDALGEAAVIGGTMLLGLMSGGY